MSAYEKAQKWEGVDNGVYTLINTPSLFQEFMENLKQQKTIAVDTETSSLDWVRAHIAGIVIGWGRENNFYIPIGHTNPETGERSLERQLTLMEVFVELDKIFRNSNITKLFWNAKYDLHILREAGFEFEGLFHDGLVMYFLLDENDSHGLKNVSLKFIDPKADSWEKEVKLWRSVESRRRRKELNKLIKAKADELKADLELYAKVLAQAEELVDEEDPKIRARRLRSKVISLLKEIASDSFTSHYYNNNKIDDISYDLVPLDLMTPYACADVHYTFVLYDKFIYNVVGHSSLADLYVNEMDFCKILFETEHSGIKIDRKYLESLGPVLDKEIEVAQNRIYEIVGRKFNVNSNDDVIQVLQDAGCRLRKLTKTCKKAKDAGEDVPNKYSVDADVLEGLAATNEVANVILEYRKITKLKSTYVDSILEKLDDNDFLHTHFNQNVRTGRVSSSGPNTQNISAKDGRIRRAFISPSDDYVFVFIDLSQIELRIVAHCSQDANLLSCYPKQGKGRDVHSLTCAEVIMNMNYEDFLVMRADMSQHDENDLNCKCNHCIADGKRKRGKTVNFAVIFGTGKYTMQKQLSTPQNIVPVEECASYIYNYKARYPGVKRLIKDTEFEVLQNKYVTNEFGRFRRFPDIHKLEGPPRWRVFRQAFNFKIQSTAADLFKYSITRIDKITKGTGIRLVNTVHDETQFYIPRNRLDLLPDIKHAMEDFPQFSVPIIADVSYSEQGNWANKVEGFPPQ